MLSLIVDLVMLFENFHLLGDLGRKYLIVNIVVYIPEFALKSVAP